MSRNLVVMLVLGAGLYGTAIAAPSNVQELWNGTWTMTEDTTNERWIACCEGAGGGIPLLPKFQKIRDDFAAIPFNSTTKTIGNLPKCITPGMPGIMEHPLLFEFTWAPGRVNIVFQDGSYRRIWTDGRGFPEDLARTYQGYSIGRWEGDTLVVETRGISSKSEMFLSAPISTTRNTRVVERITVKKGKFKSRLTESDRALHFQTTLEDPGVFTRPYTFEMTFIPVPISFETGCAAHNRDNGNSFDLTPPDDDDE